MRILVCGQREFNDASAVNRVLGEYLAPDLVIIEGTCKGADTLAHDYAVRMHLANWRFPAQWRLHGKRAGFLRNQRMLDEGKPDLVIAFFNDPDSSKGTKMMVEISRRAGVKVQVEAS